MAPARWSVLPVLLVLLSLGACGSSEKIAVERSAVLPGEVQAARFVLVPAKGQEKARDFAKYANQITAQLASHGFVRVEDAGQARYALMFSYDGDGLDRAAEERHRAAGASAERKQRGEAKTQRSLSIILYDLSKPNRPDEAVFSGFAECSVDSVSRDPQVMPAMIDAVMKEFPGRNRENYTVSLPDFK
jgi:hypothetical protein